MRVSRARMRLFWSEDRGFTLIEVLATITIMGIVFAIATSSWQSVVESRHVDSATNQVTGDLRLAHTSATNQLNDWVVVRNPFAALPGLPGAVAGTDYYLVQVRTPITSSVVTPRNLPGTTQLTDFGVRLKPDGSTHAVDDSALGSPATVMVSSAGGSLPSHAIEVRPATSRVQIDP